MRVVSAFLLLAGLTCGEASAQAPWEQVTSTEGNFSLEMPVPPSIHRTLTRKNAAGVTRELEIGCRTDTGIYQVYRIDFPTAIVRGAEQAMLNMVRDEFADDWNGKVISQKQVRAGNRIGRDFTIRGKPAEEIGVLTLRARMYLDGKSIYLVLVGSAPNRELPEDTGRFLGSLAIGEKRARAAGTPEPEPTGTELPGWGLAIDPDK
ncbi:MAG: hypothetical protein JO112_08215, partial [Planctomycetes bacterium]|nr:hypothetical protein [Planctomycetota bacterium]